MLLVEAMCWCARSEVEIPVSFVREGRTDACAYPGCGPGCEMVNIDFAAELDDAEEHQPTRRKHKMNKFNPGRYDPRVDSSPGCTPREDAVVLFAAEGLCGCGCKETTNGKSKFKMGHDARLKGILSRALSAEVSIHLTDPDSLIVDVVDALKYAERFTTAKVNWPDRIRESAALTTRNMSRKASERAILERAAREGAVQVGTWDRTGSVAAIYLIDGRREIEFVDPLDGTIRKEAV